MKQPTRRREKVSTQKLMGELNSCIRNHADWLADFHRSLVCRLPADARSLAEDAHLRCRFGRWYRQNLDK